MDAQCNLSIPGYDDWKLGTPPDWELPDDEEEYSREDYEADRADDEYHDTNFYKENLMPLTDPSQGVTVNKVKGEIAKLEADSRLQLKRLRALLRVLEAEAAEKQKEATPA